MLTPTSYRGNVNQSHCTLLGTAWSKSSEWLKSQRKGTLVPCGWDVIWCHPHENVWPRDSSCEHENMRMAQITFKQENHNPISQRDLRSRLAAELLKVIHANTDRQTDRQQKGRKERKEKG